MIHIFYGFRHVDDETANIAPQAQGGHGPGPRPPRENVPAARRVAISGHNRLRRHIGVSRSVSILLLLARCSYDETSESGKRPELSIAGMDRALQDNSRVNSPEV